ncbi:MAG: ClbS/DfsB family four-helix bundle protein [Candidatus Eisenbacteria bacterium]|nr:ClbS/DfsB family four-helix bundle protein [Candidatus Eisenbacteria bacterium]
MNRQQLLGRLESAWRDLRASYAHLPDSAMMEPGVTGSWSVRDIIAHVSSWEEEALSHLPGFVAGVRPPKYSHRYGGIDAFNARVIEALKGLSLAEVLRRRDETHRRLLDYLRAVPEGQIARETPFRRRLRLDTYGHYPKHAAAIRQWRSK